MGFIDKNKQDKIYLYTTSLMLMVASADDNISTDELEIIKKNLVDYFNIDKDSSKELIEGSYNVIENATDIYEIGSFINESFNNEEKIKLLCCIFEIAYSDKDFHFMERHIVNQIANILNLNKDKILKAKKEVLENLL